MIKKDPRNSQLPQVLFCDVGIKEYNIMSTYIDRACTVPVCNPVQNRLRRNGKICLQIFKEQINTKKCTLNTKSISFRKLSLSEEAFTFNSG